MAAIGFGDEMMVSGRVRELYDAEPRKVRIAYENPARWHEVFDHNPKIAAIGEQGDFQELQPRVHGLRPYCALKSGPRWVWKPYRPPRGELYFTAEEIAFRNRYAGRVIFETRIKANASPNKEWGWTRWGALNGMASRASIPVTQLGPTPYPQLHGAEYIQTRTMRLAAAVISSARAVVTHEGAFHHVAAAFRIPTVVIYGGYISPEVTGYDDQMSLFTGGELGCGSRNVCVHCRKAMADISPELVFEKLTELLDGNLRRSA